MTGVMGAAMKTALRRPEGHSEGDPDTEQARRARLPVRSRGDASGERALMCAVLADAINCLSEWRRRPGPAADARRWVMSRDRTWPFTFENLCDALGFSAEGLRRRLIDETPSLETLRQEVVRANGCRVVPSGPLTRTARAARDAAILKRRAEGTTLVEIARQFGLSTGQVANIVRAARADRTPVSTEQTSNGPVMSPRESTIVRLLALGRGTREIAAKLGISPLTVHVHLSNVFRNLGVHNRRALVAYARRVGLVEAPGPDAGDPATCSSPR